MLTETPAGAALDPEGRARLHELERVVERNLASFLEIGRALLEIQDSGRLLEHYPNFDAYLTGRWGMTRSRGNDLMR